MKPFLYIFWPMFLLLTMVQSVHAQKETTWWYFMFDAGVEFSSGSPLADTNMNDSAFDNGFGSSADMTSISSNQGDLLFYASYLGVFNRNHKSMPNGILNSNTTSSSESNSVIIPRPNHPDQYYYFYNRTALHTYPDGITSGTFYNLVDMTLDDGLGDIVDTVKNVFLVDSTEEKITACPHANGIDYWLMVRIGGTNEYHAYLVTEGGVSHTPVITELGATYNGYGPMQGNLRFNHRANILVHYYGSALEIYDFDNATGELSNLRNVNITVGGGLGIEFSADDSKLYIAGPIQFDMTVPTQSAIQASETMLHFGPAFMNGLQMGLDGKIYGNNFINDESYYLDVINNPNEAGFACNFQDSAVYLGGKRGRYAVPQFLSSYFVLNLYADTVCVGEAAEFYMNFSIIDDATWNFGDPASGAANTSTLLAPTHVFSDTGAYTVTLIAQNGVKTDTVIKTIYVKAAPEIDIGPDVGYCTTSNIPVAFSSGLATKRDREGIYSWSINDSVFSTDSTLLVDSVMLSFSEQSSGNGRSVTLSFTNECGTDRDTALLLPSSPLTVAVPPIYKTCTDSIEIIASIDSITSPTSLTWHSATDSLPPIVVSPPLTTLPVLAVRNELGNNPSNDLASYPVAFSATNGCGTYTDSTLLVYLPQPDGLLPPDSLHCSADSFVLSHPNSHGVQYTWSDGTTDSTFIINESMRIALTSSSECGSLRDSFIVAFVSLPERILPLDTAVCFDGFDSVTLRSLVSLNVSTSSTQALVEDYIWSTTDTTPEIKITASGEYALTITAGQCTASDTTSVHLRGDCYDRCKPYPPNVISPNNDGINDQFVVTVDCVYETFELLIYNRWGQRIHQSFGEDNELRWDASVASSPAPDGTYYYIINLKKPEVDNVEYRGSVTVVR